MGSFEKIKPKKSLKRLLKFLPNTKSFFHPFSNIKTHHHLFLCFDDLRGKLAVFLHTKLLVRHKIKSKRNKEVRTPKKKKKKKKKKKRKTPKKKKKKKKKKS